MTDALSSRIQLFQGDITTLSVDAIVTAANELLCGGGGVDGAVHNAAGTELVSASMALGPCPPGESRITDGYQLSAKFVIHSVGPIFESLEFDSPTLTNVYNSALSLAHQNQVNSIAFPCISTGAFGFPFEAATEIAINVVVEWLKSNPLPETVTFCCYGDHDYKHYRERLLELGLIS